MWWYSGPSPEGRDLAKAPEVVARQANKREIRFRMAPNPLPGRVEEGLDRGTSFAEKDEFLRRCKQLSIGAVRQGSERREWYLNGSRARVLHSLSVP